MKLLTSDPFSFSWPAPNIPVTISTIYTTPWDSIFLARIAARSCVQLRCDGGLVSSGSHGTSVSVRRKREKSSPCEFIRSLE